MMLEDIHLLLCAICIYRAHTLNHRMKKTPVNNVTLKGAQLPRKLTGSIDHPIPKINIIQNLGLQ